MLAFKTQENYEPPPFLPVVLETIGLSNFPAVSIYIKQGNNYILYKSRERALTVKDLTRLHEAGNKFVYVYGADIDTVQQFFEDNLESIFDESREGISNSIATVQTIKPMILSPILVNYISDIFKNPEDLTSFDRCRLLLEKMLTCLTDQSNLMEILSKVVHHKAYLLVHSTQVAILTMFINDRLFSLTHDELIDSGLGGMLHDIGMMFVSSDLLEKTDTLSKGDYFKIRHHPKQGHDLLVRYGVDNPLILSSALHHHERHNGTGYPKRMYENEISRSAAVMALCDVYCSLTTERPYRPATPPEVAMQMMHNDGQLFHPEILGGFLDVMGYDPLVAESHAHIPKKMTIF